MKKSIHPSVLSQKERQLYQDHCNGQIDEFLNVRIKKRNVFSNKTSMSTPWGAITKKENQ